MRNWFVLFVIGLTSLHGAHLKAVILLGSDCKPLRTTSGSGVTTEGFEFPKLTEDLDRRICWGEKVNKDLIAEIQKEIIRAYQKAGRPLVIVDIPPQDLSHGIIQYQITEGVLGEINVSGNRWFSDRLYKRSIHLQPGCPIDEHKLLNNIALLNRSPFHRTDVLYSPGDQEGYTNIELINQDRFPLRVYAGGDNTGTRQIDRTRMFAGFDCGYAFGLDHTLSYQYCTSPGFSKFQSHTFRYFGTLPWGHVFLLYGGFSTVNPHMTDFHSEGKSGQASLRYEIPMPSLFESWLQELQLGFDGKSTNNNLIFSGSGDLEILKDTANLSQFVLGYDLGWKSRKHLFSLNVLFFYSPGPMLANEEEEDLAVFRVGAKNQYLYGTAATSYQYTYPHIFSLWAQGRFQKSSRPLLASEEISIGGYDTIRGFDERLYNGDNGVIGNFEFQSVEISLLEKYCNPRIKDRFFALAFFDCGYADLIEEIIGEPRHAYLSSAGAGIRYRIGDWFSARLDWGFKLHNVKLLGDTSLGKLHAGLIVSY